MDFNLTRKHNIIICSVGVALSMVMYIIYPYFMPRTDGQDAVAIATVAICVVCLCSVARKDNER